MNYFLSKSPFRWSDILHAESAFTQFACYRHATHFVKMGHILEKGCLFSFLSTFKHMLSTSWYVNDNINLNCLWRQLMIFNVCLSIPEQWRLPAVLWRWQTWSRREWRERDTPQSSLCVAPTAVEGAPLAYHSDHQRADRQIKHLHSRVELIEKRWVQSGWTTDEKPAHKTFSLLWLGLILLENFLL